MDKATLTMIENLLKNTGKSLEQWTELIKSMHFNKHGEIINYLKESHGMTYGFANLIAHKAKGSDAGSADNPEDLISRQYLGKEHFRPLYDMLLNYIQSLGKDIEIAPKNTYVSLRRKKQFAVLNPATKSRFEVGINLKGQKPAGILEAEKPNSMCTHKISITNTDNVDPEVLNWIKTAYDHAG